MYRLSKFELKNGIDNYEQVEEWAEHFFFNLLNILNAFFVHVEVEEIVSRMAAIPFAELVKEQLENENTEIIKIAVDKVNELVEIEMDFLQGYL
ncbi:MAG TPA: hypothetical protein VFD02_06590 [Syntrophomonadaceae bacterium]|nr:hypothetical protein [Syntrophomonadaceae bacterium]